MPHIVCNDEHGRTWVVMEGDPVWEAAKHAKTRLLLPQPTLPLRLILTGWPDVEIHTAKQEMLDYLEVQKKVRPELLVRVWANLSRKFRAWKTQSALYGGREFAEQATMFSAEPVDPSSG